MDEDVQRCAAFSHLSKLLDMFTAKMLAKIMLSLLAS
jgi:hypothetical protein